MKIAVHKGPISKLTKNLLLSEIAVSCKMVLHVYAVSALSTRQCLEERYLYDFKYLNNYTN